jgi:tRNA dimethylallyltransferase
MIVAGPTGSGKSALAVALAEAFDGVVINADAMQVYRELRILTARPTPEEEERVPHRLYGVLSARDPCSAGRWRELALAAIDDARATGRLPIVVGGTGLYLRALLRGLADVPAIPDAVRREAEDRHRLLGGAGFRAELAALDPLAAARLPAGDTQRLLRAWEVVRATGRTLTEWQHDAVPVPYPARFATIILLPPRALLYPALDARFERMLAAGALAEAAAVSDLPPTLPAMKAVGVRQLMAHIRGEISFDEACATAKRETRRYAKRQLTWLRHQIGGDLVVSEQYSERLRPKLFAFIRQFLLTEGA